MKTFWKPTILVFVATYISGIGFALNTDLFMTIKGLLLALGISIILAGFVHLMANLDKYHKVKE
jgi:predicted phage tail protein